jgi:orotate phosphoribosyltransferase-like protein
MKYLVVDGMISGTGIRDQYEGIYIDPQSLGISTSLIEKLQIWLKTYEEEHHKNYTDVELVKKLDKEGIEISKAIARELKDSKITYYSDANQTRHLI